MVACSRDDRAPTIPEARATSDSAVLHVPDAPVALDVSTYDGSGETVHPDFSAPRAPWRHRVFYLALTPYPAGNQNFENPSLYASLDGVRWGAAPRAPMPLVKPSAGHLSDPDIVHASARGELFLYYREASDSDRIYLVRSADAAAWSRPQPLLVTRQFATLSPAVVRRGPGDWWMWSVDAGGGCGDVATHVELRRSSDGIAWSAPVPTMLGAPTNTFAWHLDVQWIPERGEFWALYPVKEPGTCATTALYLATSKDGARWHTKPTPVLTAGRIRELWHIVYRSTFSYDARTDRVALWLSGARRDDDGYYHWRTVAVRRPRAALFAEISRALRAQVPPAPPQIRASFTPP